MNIENLQNLYINNIENIFTPSRFRKVASHSNDIQGYSFTNRALIFIQNGYSTNVKSEISWQIAGRSIKNNAVPMGIITPIIETKYTDSAGNNVKASDLNALEFSKALALGVINKEQTIKNIRCTLVYDIADTNGVSNTLDSKNSRKLKLSTIYKLLYSYGISVEKSDNRITSFDYDNNTIKIGEDNVSFKIEICIDALIINFLNSLDTYIDFSDLEIKFFCDYFKYIIFTYFCIKNSIDFEYIAELYNKAIEEQGKLEVIVEVLDEIESLFVNYIINTENGSSDEGHKTYIAQRAAILLNILEANYESRGIKGV